VNEAGQPGVIQLRERVLDREYFHGATLQIFGAVLLWADAGQRAGFIRPGDLGFAQSV
jgi:hypothetical protein